MLELEGCRLLAAQPTSGTHPYYKFPCDLEVANFITNLVNDKTAVLCEDWETMLQYFDGAIYLSCTCSAANNMRF